MRRSLLFLLPLFLLTACSTVPSPPEGDVFAAREIAPELVDEVGTLVAANNDFTLDLYREIAAQDDENLILSPFSVATAFAMVRAGAAGPTAGELDNTFGFDALAGEDLPPAYGALLTSLDRGNAFGGYRLEVAQGLWRQTGYSFLPDYLATLTGPYRAGESELNFAGDPEGARQTVNRWVAERTQDRIQDLMPPGSVTQLTRLVLANAIYFFGKWSLPFDPEDTAERGFVLADGTTITVPTMKQNDLFHAHLETGLRVLELPYAGGDLSMVFFVPDDLTAFEATLTHAQIESYLDLLHERELEIQLPRFEISTDVALRDALSALGAPQVFTEAADLSGMDGTRNLHVSAAQHKAFIRVTEDGTEAAAATGVSVGVTSIPPHIYVNRPFFYLIRDRVTDSVLFAGRVTDPR